ncbi:hypothetical protein [Pelagicoccus albus]|uniref:Uncharacterized protein n=1 Tax=Pelagicoccus albus TaxID=415222 RepID=A0A7X1B4X1_9BACT|nr:hypothetical protein [Pelagicoccus albus]MBC2604455.1 hypothetical protein [Pelagicoccus albus]
MNFEPILPSQSTSVASLNHRASEVCSPGFEPQLQGAETEKTAAQAERFSELENSFYEWRDGLDTTHPLNLPRYQQVVGSTEDFLSIVEKAVVVDGYSDPLAFVQSLSRGELATLKAIHSTGDLDPSTMTKEGALNLILPASERQDIDNDGFVERGHGVGWSFPPVNASQSVHDAWEQATEGMSESEKMLAQGMFLPSMIRLDEVNGQVVRVERSEANNPYARPNFPFGSLIDQRLENMEAFKFDMKPEQYEFQKDFLTRFGEALSFAGLN